MKCLFCKCSLAQGRNCKGKYCSNKCQADHTQEGIIQDWLLGLRKHVSRSTARFFLIKRDGNCCSVCRIIDWEKKELKFILDHNDGNATNGRPENLRLICPNCNSQTSTFSGRNKGKGRKARGMKRYSWSG